VRELLILSQVILSLQWVCHYSTDSFVSDKSKMRGFHNKRTVASWIVALMALNGKLVYDEITGWLEASENPIVLQVTISIKFLDIITVFLSRLLKNQKSHHQNHSPHNLKLKFSKSYKKRYCCFC
jgi:manganese transport protein